MKSLKESLFDGDLINKDVTLDQYFDIYIDRHRASCPTMDDDRKIIKKIEKDIDSIKLGSLDCEGLIRELSKLAQKYTKNWHGGGYNYRIYDKSGKQITTTKKIDLFDVSKITVTAEDWNGNYFSFYTYFVLDRK